MTSKNKQRNFASLVIGVFFIFVGVVGTMINLSMFGVTIQKVGFFMLLLFLGAFFALMGGAHKW